MNENEESSNALFKSELYFDLTEASAEITSAIGVKNVSIASAKLAGKTLCNTVVFTGKVGIEVANNLPKFLTKEIQMQLKNNPDIEPEKRQKMESFLERQKARKDKGHI